ncbi:hypothetical protein BKH17_06410 [Actinomyces oris]|uniref:hypothetical protein n=1 Tax=Actinomyces oris TaxID=544580 RepID=UPI000949E138|nr:hypothetical protein [Actinomyces oris]OLL12376.1 hypothetical protein BKH17_06410 [Actinomyces oris]
MQCLNFLQHLLLMEALNELTSSVRNRVAAGEILLQETLQELETIEKLLDTGTVHIKPLPGATRTTNKQIGEAA